MRAIRVPAHGGPEVLEPAELDRPTPQSGELLVEVSAAGVNFIDTYQRSGLYSVPLPFTPGVEGAGTVREVGPDVTGFTPGDRIAWAMTPGGYAEQAVVPARNSVRVPDGVDDRTAAAAMLQGMTAHFLVTSTHPIRPGETALVHAAAGGVGLLLTQLIKARGGNVIGTVSTDEKERLARAAGADEIIRYTDADVAEEVRDLTDGRGVDVVYDGVGKDTFDGSLASLRPRGTLALFGASSGPVPPVDPQRLNSGGSLFLTRPSLAHHMLDREELDRRAGEIFQAVRAGELDVRIGGSYPLEQAGRAHEDLEARRSTGKLLLLP
ncbi:MULTISPECIES: quinone oxidoreductase [unclassified Saccharopolyspora]|uniref:quinone oxidoreductase family protein n=1 Tax=unclassified Saccharopolyspora TaxID=2646250 RepID=UPI001CD5489F|nr:MULTISPECIES: quinone oxidoreductase [unclassified Saccharopolyspora]MCA1187659.1 quinone oxidoreductase [Saccharopolyspora sp. 6T]MCA1193878.1 quinone oxidoreductase [Saccharopolyspora sp. 6V]MCA1226529.1 quinone oxidoreductase [Saccharopolyspora sp. 6M]MCA1281108.1 quinone oxidoreductase [Saccharopolyspora sp. 7B]